MNIPNLTSIDGNSTLELQLIWTLLTNNFISGELANLQNLKVPFAINSIVHI